MPKFRSRKINENPPLLQQHNALKTQFHIATSGSSDFSNTRAISNNPQMGRAQWRSRGLGILACRRAIDFKQLAPLNLRGERWQFCRLEVVMGMLPWQGRVAYPCKILAMVVQFRQKCSTFDRYFDG